MFPKHERLYIRPLMNGYLIEYDYRVYKTDAKDQYEYTSAEEQYMFPNWDLVTDFVKNKPLTIPPV